MCFSEEASFAAAFALSAISILCFRNTKDEPPYYALAAIPLIFALQQMTEGLQWLYLKGIWNSHGIAIFSRYLFLLIAMVIWPIWIPLSVWLPEKNELRRQGLLALMMLGALVALYDLGVLLIYPVEASIINKSIQYRLSLPESGFWPYAAVVILPWFVSSLPGAYWAGVILALSAVISSYLYYEVFVSVWCFSAGLISFMAWYLLRHRNART